MVVNWWEKKECGHDAKEGADKVKVAEFPKLALTHGIPLSLLI